MPGRGIVRSLLVSLSVVSLACASGNVAVTSPAPAGAQGAAKPAGDKPGGDKPAPSKTIAELTKSSTKFAGLFTIYQDTVTGALQMVVRKDQVGKEYIYFSVTDEGALPAGSFRGDFGPNEVFGVRKNFNKIEFVTLNTAFYFNPASPLSRASGANISPGLLASIEIAATDTVTGEYLIKADDLFLTETLRQVKPSPRPGGPPGAGFTLGSLSKSKTHVVSIKSYPLNTDVVVQYVYENPAPTSGGGPDITDPRNVSLTIQHSFIEMPANDYQARYADPRVGFFANEVTDLTSTSVTPWRDLVNRWNLVKKNPDAPLSDPVEPITWWIENTTPLELRPAIREGVLRWNEAFAAAGFTNAMVVMEQPDTATWDAGDLRYNVLRWTASPNPPFGGYGPSFVNPRTGQILGADIMLEFIFVTNRLLASDLFEYAGQADLASTLNGASYGSCAASASLQQQALFGATALRLFGASDLEVDQFVYQSVVSLVLHEVGHTLGLNHNMKASQMLSPAELQDSALVVRRGVSGSVMDYHAVNIAPPGGRKAPAFDTHPGPYDRWAIEFGYRTSLPDASAESARTTALLNRSTEPDLAFGNDADDMRSPGGGIDPRVMVGDLSNDALTWATGRMILSDSLLKGIDARYPKPGQDYATLLVAYQMVTGQIANAAVVASRYIGGVYVSRGVDGQPNAGAPFTPVPLVEQQRAMQLLRTRFFAPDAWNASPELLAELQAPRRGYSGPGEPNIHGRVLAAQRGVLQFLLASPTQARLTDSRLYGNQYSAAQMMSDLTDAVFAADARGNVNTFRQNLQLEYVTELAGMIRGPGASNYDYVSKSAVVASLKKVQAQVATPTGDAETRAHRQHLSLVVTQALDPKS